MNADAGHRPDAKEHFRHLEAGEALFRQGDAAVAIFRLESGQYACCATLKTVHRS